MFVCTCLWIDLLAFACSAKTCRMLGRGITPRLLRYGYAPQFAIPIPLTSVEARYCFLSLQGVIYLLIFATKMDQTEVHRILFALNLCTGRLFYASIYLSTFLIYSIGPKVQGVFSFPQPSSTSITVFLVVSPHSPAPSTVGHFSIPDDTPPRHFSRLGRCSARPRCPFVPVPTRSHRSARRLCEPDITTRTSFSLRVIAARTLGSYGLT